METAKVKQLFRNVGGDGEEGERQVVVILKSMYFKGKASLSRID